jgi:hypothetical protein
MISPEHERCDCPMSLRDHDDHSIACAFFHESSEEIEDAVAGETDEEAE